MQTEKVALIPAEIQEDHPYTLAEVADLTGLSSHTLRFYEKIGIVRAVPRLPNGRRVYTATHVRWLELVLRLRDTGMTLEDIRLYADLMEAGDSTVAARLEMLEAHRLVLQARLDELHAHMAVLDYKIGMYREWTAEVATSCLRS